MNKDKEVQEIYNNYLKKQKQEHKFKIGVWIVSIMGCIIFWLFILLALAWQF